MLDEDKLRDHSERTSIVTEFHHVEISITSELLRNNELIYRFGIEKIGQNKSAKLYLTGS